MRFSHDVDVESFRQEVRQFIAEELEPEKERLRSAAQIERTNEEEYDFVMGFQQKLAKKDWLAMAWPEEYGGGGASHMRQLVYNEEMAYASAPNMSMGIAWVGPSLMLYGSDEQKNHYIPRIANADDWWCTLYSEPGAGSDLAAMQTRATRDGDDYVINGQKIWTSTAKFAQMCFCLVRTEPDAPKHQGISFLLIPMDTPGIEIRPIMQMTLDADFNEVFFTDVRIPAKNIVGKRGEGWKVANSILGHERGSLADPNVTMTRLNALINLMKDETIDGQRVIDKPAFRDRLLRIQGRVIAQQSNALRILSGQINKNQNTSMARFITKLQGTELRHELEALAIDTMGELGTLYENSPHLRDNGSWQMSYMYFLGLIIGGGTSQIQKNIISERGLGMPKEPKVQGV